jgi:hypothetical protein
MLGCSEPKRAESNCDESPGALYERRIAPLLSTDRPSTCNACHAGGLELKDFARATPCESMACLEQAGLVNLDDPKSSVLLSWIRRADDANANVSQKLVDEEHDGFLEWIEHEAECQSCEGTPCPDAPRATCTSGGGEGGAHGQGQSLGPTDDPGDCERETLEELFRGTIYENRGRCYPCHFQELDTADPAAPRFFTEVGGCEIASLATQNNVLSRRLIDIEYPDASLLLMKPLAEVDGGLPHGGGDKFTLVGDAGYSAFRYWIRRYAECESAKNR